MNSLKLPLWARYLLLGFALAAFMHLSPMTGCNKDDGPEPDPIDQTPVLDVVKAEMTADSVEAAFAAADVDAIIGFMSGESQMRSGDDIKNASSTTLQQFAEDFKNRKVVGHGSRFIEFEFDWNGVPYTVDFSLQEDGTFKIIRL